MAKRLQQYLIAAVVSWLAIQVISVKNDTRDQIVLALLLAGAFVSWSSKREQFEDTLKNTQTAPFPSAVPTVKVDSLAATTVTNSASSQGTANTTETTSTQSTKSTGSSSNDATDMKYTTVDSTPIGSMIDTEWQNEFVLLNTDKWRPPINQFQRCDCACPVSASPTTGYPIQLKEWNASRRVMPADNINTKYIEERLNKV